MFRLSDLIDITVFITVQLKQLLKVTFSVVGCSKRPKEEQAWIFFGDFLDECEGMKPGDLGDLVNVWFLAGKIPH